MPVDRNQILQLVRQYHDETFAHRKPFEPGDRINYGGRFFDAEEMVSLVDASLDFWLTAGRFANQFERALAEFLDIKHCSLVNSGSSANLLAVAALTSPRLGDRRVEPGDEIITVAATFPTTVAPILQARAIPVFVDIELPSYNADVAQLEQALGPRTKAVFLAHTLGNPFDIESITTFCRKNGLWLIEDNCDALGSRYVLGGKSRFTGTFGDLGTSSFYPPHHMTMGEGGAVYTDSTELKRIVNSFRDWGRDCWCAAGKDNSCGCRFSEQFGTLPIGYDHKYVYSHLGYNLKVTDMQAAIGCTQLKKLPGFIERRKANWSYLRKELTMLEEFFLLPEPALNSEPSWFGFMLTVRDDAPFTRNEIVEHLEAKGIQTRMLFAGNITRHPCFDHLVPGQDYRVAADLTETDVAMNASFWIGVYPGLSEDQLLYMTAEIKSFLP